MRDDFKFYDEICESPADINEAATPDGIRRLFNRNRYRSHPVVRAVFNMAEARGLKGEDIYTVMAFELLKRLEILEGLHLDAAMLNPHPPMIVPGGKDLEE